MINWSHGKLKDIKSGIESEPPLPRRIVNIVSLWLIWKGLCTVGGGGIWGSQFSFCIEAIMNRVTGKLDKQVVCALDTVLNTAESMNRVCISRLGPSKYPFGGPNTGCVCVL